MKPRRDVAVMVVTLGLLLSAVANADYKDSYKEGVTAVDRKQWSEVVRHMQEAIRQNPQAGGDDVRIYGTRMEDYLPYYYLGMALNELGRYVEAKQALDTSLQQGAIGDAPKKINRNFVRLMSEVGGKVANMPSTRDPSQNPRAPETRQQTPRQAVPAGPTPAQQLATAKAGAETELSTASDARATVSGLIQRAERLGVFAANPGLRARWDRANEQLGTARRQLDTTTSAAVADNVKSTAVRLAGEFIQIQGELGQQIQSAERANEASAQRAADEQSRQIQNLLNSLENDISEAERLLSRSTEAPHPSLNVSRQRLAGAISAARGADSASSEGVLNNLRSALRSSAADLRTAMSNVPAPEDEAIAVPEPEAGDLETPTGGPPSALRRAAASFFRGDDDSTLSLLEGASFSDPRAVLQAGLLRAASLYRRFLVGGEADDQLLRAARGEVARCKGVDPSFEPDARYFSPTFVALYRETQGP